MKIFAIAFCVSFLFAIIIAPFVIKYLRKLKYGQSILIYVEQHKSKSGTPTMGGIVFIISSLVVYFVFYNKNNILATTSILSLVCFGLLGFLDDFIKIKYKQNEGLKPYQKIIGQVGLSLIIAIFIYKSELVGGEINIPFTDISLNLSYWIIPLVVIFYIAVVNSVNLIDGLDGLCGSVSFVVLIIIGILSCVALRLFEGVKFEEINNLITIIFIVAGAVLGYLIFNCYPAKVFMGDTGSLGLGGFIASVFALTKNYLLIVLIGGAYVITSLSVIIQVLVYKLTKKRVFKMSPLHHHFEQGCHESKVVAIYTIMTIVVGMLTISLYL